MSTNRTSQQPSITDTPVDRELLKAVLQSARLLVEPSPTTFASAAQSTLTLEEAAEILSRGGAPSLSQQVDEARGLK